MAGRGAAEADELACVRHLVSLHAELARDRRGGPPRECPEMIGHNRVRQRLRDTLRLEPVDLQQQAVAQVARPLPVGQSPGGP